MEVISRAGTNAVLCKLVFKGTKNAVPELLDKAVRNGLVLPFLADDMAISFPRSVC